MQSPIEHFCDTSYLNSLHFSPVTRPVNCRLWNAEEGGVRSNECGVECIVWSVECKVSSVVWGVWSAQCEV